MRLHPRPWRTWPLALGVGLVPLFGLAGPLTASGAPQDPSSPGGGNLRRVIPQAPAADAVDWEARLTDPDLDLREKAFDDLVRAASRDRNLRGDLHQWARGSDGLAWTARLALRELEHAQRDPFADLFGGPFFGRTPGGFGLLPRFIDPWEGGGLDPDEFLRNFGWNQPPIPALPAIPGAESQSRSIEIQQGPLGVEVTIEETVDGKTETKTYKAKSMEELRKNYPELDLGGTQIRIGSSPGSDPVQRLRRVLPGRELLGIPRTDILGVYLRQGSDEETDLVVEKIVPGSLAEAMEVAPGDQLVRLNGVRLFEVDDVARGLAAAPKDGSMTLEVITADGESRTRTWSPPKPIH